MERVRKQIQYEYISDLGLSGRNVNVCIIDSGIFLHQDFDKRIIYFKDFTNNNSTFIYDDNGHGTHVCGIVAGNGISSNYKYMGIAPNSNLIILKVLDQKGNGNLEDLLNAIEWVYLNHKKYNIRIVNLSISISYHSIKFKDYKKLQKLLDYIKFLYFENVIIVTAAGNDGPSDDTLSEIGNNVYTICVGCHDGNYLSNSKNKCENYSGRGDKRGYFLKPDVVAPGSQIISCSASRNHYIKRSGTSMSCPIVSGIAANLVELSRNARNTEIMQQIRLGTIPLNVPQNQQGYGMISCKKIFERYYI